MALQVIWAMSLTRKLYMGGQRKLSKILPVSQQADHKYPRYLIKDVETGDHAFQEFWTLEHDVCWISKFNFVIPGKTSSVGLRVIARYPDTSAFYYGALTGNLSRDSLAFLVMFEEPERKGPLEVSSQYVLPYKYQPKGPLNERDISPITPNTSRPTSPLRSEERASTSAMEKESDLPEEPARETPTAMNARLLKEPAKERKIRSDVGSYYSRSSGVRYGQSKGCRNCRQRKIKVWQLLPLYVQTPQCRH